MAAPTRAGVYGKQGLSRHAPLMSVASGLEALGFRAVWRNPGPVRMGEREDFALVVVLGAKAQSALIAANYALENYAPCLIVEQAFLCRGNQSQPEAGGYWQLGPCLNWLPPEPCPGDRFTALALDRATEPRGGGDCILICGQVPGDAAHGLSEKALAAWYQTCIGQIREHAPGVPIRWRPHPLASMTVPGVDQVSADGVPLEHDLQDAAAVVTLNSTCGLTALLAGVPVFCSELAYYSAFANREFARLADPEWHDTAPLFNRLAYAQWTHAELTSGAALRFVLGHVDGFRDYGSPVEQTTPEPLAPQDSGSGPDDGLDALDKTQLLQRSLVLGLPFDKRHGADTIRAGIRKAQDG
ncbi:MAG: hypothetical protein GY851_35715 [bacterium]|nr:hypothetical protein [bacterium]